MHFLQIVWDPASEGINIFGDFKIHYYSLMWMVAFILGWYVMKKIYKNENQSDDKLDSIFIYLFGFRNYDWRTIGSCNFLSA